MLKYAVRSRQIVDLIAEIRRRTLILSPHFQRNLVWRQIHKADFIDTILCGFPFPQIFISKGTIDIDSMQSTSSIVDGQQRMSAIQEFIQDGFSVKGEFFSQLSVGEREEFLKYEVPVIDLDLRDNDLRVQEIFKRLNRTFYSLSTIERLSTEYASSEFMLVAKYLCGEIDLDENGLPNERHENDPNISVSFLAWASARKVSSYREFVLDGKIFSPYETSRMVHLMYTLNLMATYERGFYNRNDGVKPSLEEHADDYASKDLVIADFENAARVYGRLRFQKGSMFLNKANAFSLFYLLSHNFKNQHKVDIARIKIALADFSDNVPADYSLAAREAVNNKKERDLRDLYLREWTGLKGHFDTL